MAKARTPQYASAGPVTIPAFLAALVALVVVCGCLPEANKNQALGPAPRVDTDAPDAQTAFWRDQYKKNRTVPPREFTVAPKPARNNDFGEFDDALYAGLDSQPTLPGLPGGQDLMPMLGGPASYPVPGALSPQYRVGADGVALSPVSFPGAAGAAAAAASGQAGITAGTHYYPIEQLVFGGDYPDIDKPELYRLMPKDAISVTVRDHPEFSGKLDIQADGTVRVPNTPDLIRLRGLTVDEAAEEIRRNLQVYIKGECVVRVQANRARGGYYFVFGDVSQPGRFPMGLEPIKLSDAVLAANWEANPNRMDPDDELGPAFPAANPRGKFMAPRSADMARVMLITPHRSQPVRTVHDIRSAMLGMKNEDPVVRPGQIVVVPSLDPRRNVSLGLDMPDNTIPPDGLMPGQGFSGAGSPARLPAVSPDWHPSRQRRVVEVPAIESNMAMTYDIQSNTEAVDPYMESYGFGGYCETPVHSGFVVSREVEMPKTALEAGRGAAPAPPVAAQQPEAFEETRSLAGPATRGKDRSLPRNRVDGIGVAPAQAPAQVDGQVTTQRRPGRRLQRKTAVDGEKRAPGESGRGSLEGWNKGF